MSQTLTLQIRWTKPGDEIPGRRLTTVTLDVPHEGEPSEMEAPLLNLDGRASGHELDEKGHLYQPMGRGAPSTVTLVGPRDEVQPEDVAECVRALNLAIVEKVAKDEAAAEETKARKDAERAQRIREAEAAIREGRPLRRYTDAVAEPPYPWGVLQIVSDECRQIAREANKAHEEDQARRKRETEEHNEKLREARWNEKTTWARAHGSARLKAQLDQEGDGWPLYLHERLAAEFPGGRLAEDADEWDEISNPTEAQLSQRARTADQALALGLFADSEHAYRAIRWRWQPTQVYEDYYEGEEDDEDECRARTPRLVMEYYRPGSPDIAWKRYTVAFAAES